MKKREILLCVIFLSIFLLNYVQSAQIVQAQPEAPKPKSFWENTKDFIFSPIFLIIFVLFIFIIIFGVLAFFVAKWIIKYFKSRDNVFYHLKNERIRLAKIQTSYRVRSYFHPSKNTPIRLIRKNQDGRPFISEPIGYHKGNYTSNEGNIIIAMNLIGKATLWFFPTVDLLIIPNREKVDVEAVHKDGTKKIITFNNIPMADEIVQFNQNEILLSAEAISHLGHFYIPVLKSKDGKLIDLAMPIYASLKEVIVEEFLQEQTNTFISLSRKAVEINPNFRVASKLSDQNSSVDVPGGNSP